MSPSVTKGTWLRCPMRLGAATARLICCPFAGGSASAYQGWSRRAAPYGIEVHAVQLPGREERLGEPPLRSMTAIIDCLIDVIQPLEGKPLVLFGHSMGALMAYELARTLQERGLRGPDHVFVSAHRAPHLPRSRPPLHALTDTQLVAALQEMGGTPAAILQSRELWELFFPPLRADLIAAETYRIERATVLSCPITAFAGSHDSRVDVAEMEPWAMTTSSTFGLQVFPGRHFFIHEHEQEVVKHIVAALERPAA